MRTKGFICIALGLAAVAGAGQRNYLPSVGPRPLRFHESQPATRTPTLQYALASTPPSAPENTPPVPEPTEIPGPEPAQAPDSSNSLMQNPPVAPPETLGSPAMNVTGPLIGPSMETNAVVTPQMLLRYFLPSQGHNTKEAILVTPQFNPAQPPATSSTATFSKPK